MAPLRRCPSCGAARLRPWPTWRREDASVGSRWIDSQAATGASWQVALSDEPGEPSLFDQEKIAEERVRADVLADPNVRAVMDALPDAQLESFDTTRGH